MSKDLSPRYYQKKVTLQKMASERYQNLSGEKKKNMIINNLQIFQKTKNKG